MSVSLKAIVVAIAAFSAIPAQAQLLGPKWQTNVVLTEQDLSMIHAAVAQRIHGKPVGTTTTWRNPDSGNSGTIELVRDLALKNQKCEEIAYTAYSTKPGYPPEHFHFTSCLQTDGTWKIAS